MNPRAAGRSITAAGTISSSNQMTMKASSATLDLDCQWTDVGDWDRDRVLAAKSLVHALPRQPGVSLVNQERGRCLSDEREQEKGKESHGTNFALIVT